MSDRHSLHMDVPSSARCSRARRTASRARCAVPSRHRQSSSGPQSLHAYTVQDGMHARRAALLRRRDPPVHVAAVLERGLVALVAQLEARAAHDLPLRARGTLWERDSGRGEGRPVEPVRSCPVECAPVPRGAKQKQARACCCLLFWVSGETSGERREARALKANATTGKGREKQATIKRAAVCRRAPVPEERSASKQARQRSAP